MTHKYLRNADLTHGFTWLNFTSEKVVVNFISEKWFWQRKNQQDGVVLTLPQGLFYRKHFYIHFP